MEDDRHPQSAVSWVKQHSKHRKAMRQVLTELAMFIDAGNACPSHKDIAEETGLSKTTVRHSLGELEKDGTIIITKNGGKKVKGGKKDCYQIAGLKSAAPESVSTTTVVPTTTVTTTAPMVTTVISDPLKHESPDTHTRAAGEIGPLSLSLSAVESLKDKNTAPSGAASGIPEKPERPRKTKGTAVEVDTYHRLLRGVAIRSFGVDPEDPQTKDLLDKSAFERAGRIVKWLRSKQITPEKLAEFYSWYRLEHDGINAPRDLTKFKEQYAGFVQCGGKPSVAYSPTTAFPARRQDAITVIAATEEARTPPHSLPGGELFDPSLLRNDILARQKLAQEKFR